MKSRISRLLRFFGDVGFGVGLRRLGQEAKLALLTHLNLWPVLGRIVKRSWRRSRSRRTTRSSVPDSILTFPAGDWPALLAQILSGRFRILGRQFGGWDRWDWRSDWVHSSSWGIDRRRRWNFYAATTEGDVKLPWEVSRFEWLRWGWKAAEETNSSARYDEFVRAQLSSWLDENPFGVTVNWVPMEAGVRLVNLALLRFQIFSSRASISGGEGRGGMLEVLDDMIALNAGFAWIGREEFTSPRGNHFAVELAAIAIAEVCGARGAPRRRRMSWCRNRLEEEVVSQIGPDGEGCEGSPSYHRLVVESLLLALTAIQVEDPKWTLGAVAMDRLSRAACYLECIRRPDGDVPQFGDSDDAGFFFNPWSQRRDPIVVGSLIRGITDDTPSPATGAARFDSLGGQRMAVAEDNGWWAALWGGVDTSSRRSSHAHDDAGSLELFYHNIPVIVDFGTPPYTGPDAGRVAARSRHMHNAAVVSECGGTVYRGPWLSEKSMVPEGLSADPLESTVFVDLVCNATGRHPTRTRRLVKVHPDEVVVRDEVSGTDGPLHWSFILPAIWQLERQTEHEWVATGPGGAVLSLRFAPCLSVTVMEAVYYQPYGCPNRATRFDARRNGGGESQILKISEYS